MAKTIKDPLLSKLIKILKSKKALNIVALDLRQTRQNVCDFFIICHGESAVQTHGIAQNTIRELREQAGIKPLRAEGLNNSEWILLDFGDIVAHIFREDVRANYQIESLWGDAIELNF